jgi:hypothetical protein
MRLRHSQRSRATNKKTTQRAKRSESSELPSRFVWRHSQHLSNLTEDTKSKTTKYKLGIA